MTASIGSTFVWLAVVTAVTAWIPMHHSSANLQRRGATKISTSETMKRSKGNFIDTQVSLAGKYSVVRSNRTWELFPIDDVVAGKGIPADGARSMEALKSTQTASVQPVAILSCDGNSAKRFNIELKTYVTMSDEDMELLDVLQRIYAQWIPSFDQLDDGRDSAQSKISFFQEGSKELVADLSTDSGLQQLFDDIVDMPNGVEWVEMVCCGGAVLGRVPRRLVHTCNLLHRGIGVLVTKDQSIDFTKNDFPSIYVHRRSASKRIFPSLYDMFVGGVSVAGESSKLTARREVAEELGLSQALDDEDALSDPILVCTVCTSYNRCVVTLFSYIMNSEEEAITWQEEEVDWGNFVPYPVVVAAADRSIDRFVKAETWPGSYPPMQSNLKGYLPDSYEYDNQDWIDWDFVPDGLLVWEAWLDLLNQNHCKGQVKF